jgi:hypothetical protein
MTKPEQPGGCPVSHRAEIERLVTLATLAAVATLTATAAGEAVVARRTLLARTGDVDSDLATLKILVVELGDGFLGVFGRGEFHKGKTP